MYTLMLSMNIASNGANLAPEALLQLKRQYRTRANDPHSQLAYHRALWRLSGFDDYRYTLSRRCFAMPESDIRVQVAGGKIHSARCLEPGGETVPVEDEVGTIDDYFDWIEQALRDAPESVRAQYHSLHGYPLSFTLLSTHQGQPERRLA